MPVVLPYPFINNIHFVDKHSPGDSGEWIVTAHQFQVRHVESEEQDIN
jgi:hypothetical protein